MTVAPCEETAPPLGISLGAQNCVIAYKPTASAVQLVSNESSNLSTPSTVSFGTGVPPDRSREVGSGVNAPRDARNAIYDFVPLVGGTAGDPSASGVLRRHSCPNTCVAQIFVLIRCRALL